MSDRAALLIAMTSRPRRTLMAGLCAMGLLIHGPVDARTLEQLLRLPLERLLELNVTPRRVSLDATDEACSRDGTTCQGSRHAA